MSQIFAGLDFGTTNSTLGLAPAAGGNAGPRLLAVEGDAPTLPSALFFSFEDGITRFGRAAVFEYVDGANSLMETYWETYTGGYHQADPRIAGE